MNRTPPPGTGQFTMLGIEVGLSVVVGLLGGWWLDEKLGTSPWLALAGTGFGMATAGRVLIRAGRHAKRLAELEDEKERKARKEYLDERTH